MKGGMIGSTLSREATAGPTLQLWRSERRHGRYGACFTDMMKGVGAGRRRGPFRILANIRQQLSERVGRGRGHILRLPEHIFDGQETLRTQRLAFEVSGLSICFLQRLPDRLHFGPYNLRFFASRFFNLRVQASAETVGVFVFVLRCRIEELNLMLEGCAMAWEACASRKGIVYLGCVAGGRVAQQLDDIRNREVTRWPTRVPLRLPRELNQYSWGLPLCQPL